MYRFCCYIRNLKYLWTPNQESTVISVCIYFGYDLIYCASCLNLCWFDPVLKLNSEIITGPFCHRQATKTYFQEH